MRPLAGRTSLMDSASVVFPSPKASEEPAIRRISS
jgi:hypothetical protein